MELLDARRLTGPNLQLRGAGALVELRFASPEEADRALPLLDLEHEALTRALGLPPADLRRRRFIDREGREGAALATPAPLDALYTALDALELAVQRVRAGLRGDDPGPLSAALPPLLAARQREARPALLALVAAAEARGLPVLVDDELCTLGHGARSITWPLGQLPAPDQIPWSQLGAIPIALITGTNGKTTCSRLLARVVRCAGLRPGNTTTDGISVDERVIEPGDWTGPAAARLVLRRPDVDIAVLETARGGILRRGLAPHRCDAALITNISADHLGDYGVVDIDGMAQVKAVVTTVVAPTGRVVLGADSPPLCRLPRAFPAPLVWFSLSPDQPTLAAHRRAGGEAWYVAEGQLVHAVGDHESPLIAVADVPLTLGGAARYNVQNALAVAALAHALHLPRPAILEALRGFTASARDNPGRVNLYECRGARVLLDFAHNPDGIAALGEVIHHLRLRHPGGRLLISLGLAGDRSDDDIRASAAAVLTFAPDHVIVRELPHYLRGRAPGEVSDHLERAFTQLGHPPSALGRAEDEPPALLAALDWARPGDLIVVLVHTEREAIRALLDAQGATTAT
ncbi:MAG: Mur ligase [Nannocystis sp.]|nr:Mur ligase [Nannocystis sp.]